MRAPIVLFVYKRLKQTIQTVDALRSNILAGESDLFIYADGPKSDADRESVQSLRDYLKEISGFKSVVIVESPENKGLALSIVKGVSEAVNRYGRAIVLEDDIVTSPYFLQFMNDALDEYANDAKVMSISGYMYPHSQRLPDTIFFNVPLCWGWATWKRAWDQYNDSASFHIDFLDRTNGWRAFNKFGGKYLERQLRKNARGTMNTWFIYWHASVFYHKGFCLYPSRTLVHNIGFDSSGEHGASTRKYYSPISRQRITVNRQSLIEDSEARKIILRFYLLKNNRYINAIKRIYHRIKPKTSLLSGLS